MEEIKTIKEKFKKLTQKRDLPSLEKRLHELEKKSSEQNFWGDKENAQKVMGELGEIKEEVESFGELEEKIKEVEELTKLAKEEDDKEMQKELAKEVEGLLANLEKLRLRVFLGGKYDGCNAIFSIYAGQGGTEARDWTEMLLRMYLRYFEKMDWKTEIVHEVKGEDAGISTVTLEVYGKYVYGYLKREHGTHRLVRVSPFNAQNLRQTSFAGVEVAPLFDETSEDDIEINDDDLIFSAVRSGGKGGQNVNKVATSVRITHKPTGITVSCSSERSQLQNRKSAMNLLKAKLFAIEQEKMEEEKKDLKGEHKVAAWGNQIRNYVLQPYKLVKDLRTGVESTNPESVLDGNLEEFIEAEIRM